MATLVLQTVGAAVGGSLFGPLGAIAGRAVGALAGSAIDQRLFGPEDRVVEGPRLDNVQVLSSREGTAIPRVFGRTRVAGEVIWATQFNEVLKTQSQSQGSKGGSKPKTTVKTYSYFANFAVGLCEGEIAGIRRIWADGKEIEQGDINFRIYRGTQDQLPDALIELKQGAGNAPAYRGLAYVVFEDFGLEDFGNRIPQISIEVLKPIGKIENAVYGVNLIPGATEFGYDPEPVVETLSRVEYRKLNTHQNLADTDFLASLDELMMLCPNLKQVSLVVAWFGDDLRAGHCTLQPKTETQTRTLHRGSQWSVAGLNRSQTAQVSSVDGVLSYGGSPSDLSVVRAIQELKSRGLKVCLNPFIMMDIAPYNPLPDPYGNSTQKTFPWRGRITCFPAIGEVASPDKTSAAGEQVASFLGQIQLSDVTVDPQSPGSWLNAQGASEWSYRHMIFHYARLAEFAGGVDLFLIGSEMVGLTRVRDSEDGFPFVDGLKAIASDVKSLLGTNCTVTYAADWSEYFGYHPQDGSGDVFFNLDPLWASSDIDAVAIDNYMPIADWRDDQPDPEEGYSSTDISMLQRHIASGEGHDWYYASNEDRAHKLRTPITDGFEKPWVFRFKDLKSWWNNWHFDRVSGVESNVATDWLPQSKPIIFAEFGAPAIHNSANQPNVFFDAKSAESAVPYFSNGGRSDDAMLSYIAAQQNHWDASGQTFDEQNNPLSTQYSGRMVDFEASQLWAWDARPFPQFPDNQDVWADGENWQRGHWLNGRLGSVRIGDLLQELLKAIGVSNTDTSRVDGSIDGYVIGSPASVRAEIEALLELYQISVFEENGTIVFKSKGIFPIERLPSASFVEEESQPSVTKTLVPRSELSDHVLLDHIDPATEFQNGQIQVEKVNAQNQRKSTLSLPIVSEGYVLQPVLEDWLHTQWTARKTLTFSLPLSMRHLRVGDYVQVNDLEPNQVWQIVSMEEGKHLTLQAKAVDLEASAPVNIPSLTARNFATASDPTVLATFLDLPYIEPLSETVSNFVAVSSKPWVGSVALYASPTTDDYALRQVLEQPATVGELLEELSAEQATSRWVWNHRLRVKLYVGEVFSAAPVQVLAGNNAIAVRARNNAWEILQFTNAELIGENEWELSGLLRGQSGTELEASIGSEIGADIVVLNEAVEAIARSESQKGQVLQWSYGKSDKAIGDASFVQEEFALGHRGDVPFKPVHLTAREAEDGSIYVEWIRRNRLISDSWVPLEIPLDEASESYTVQLRDELQQEHVFETNSAFTSISPAQLQTWFAHQPVSIDISVAQNSTSVGPGSFAHTSLHLNS